MDGKAVADGGAGGGGGGSAAASSRGKARARRGRARGAGKPRARAKGLVPIRSFARIKPLGADRAGGGAAAKRIAAFDEFEGTVAVALAAGGRAAAGGPQVFDHLDAVIGPEATQEHAYGVVAAPLVEAFVAGTDVDIIFYGQTGAGKTFSAFGPPHSMARASRAVREGAGDAVAAADVLREEHGFVLRAGFAALAAVEALNASGASTARLHGSMVELWMGGWADQSALDLLNNREPCFVDDKHHLQGAAQVPMACAADVVHLAAAVETRLTRGTRMNDTSSRSHCVTVLTLTVLDRASGDVRQSRLQFFDMMGSERFKGANSAHDPSKSSKSSEAGWEGIFANWSLSTLMGAVDTAAEARRTGRKAGAHLAGDFMLTKMMRGSLVGSARTAMLTCLSQAPRNGEETYLSLKYSAGVAKLCNAPRPAPAAPLRELLAAARAQLAKSEAVLRRGVRGKYAGLRAAQVSQFRHEVAVLEELQGDDGDGAAASRK